MPSQQHACNGLARPTDESMLAQDNGTDNWTRFKHYVSAYSLRKHKIKKIHIYKLLTLDLGVRKALYAALRIHHLVDGWALCSCFL